MLAGPRVRLVPVPRPVAAAVAHDPAGPAGPAQPAAPSAPGLPEALADAGLTAGPGWPHADSADALRGLALLPAQEADPVGLFLVLDEQDRVVGEAGLVGPPDAEGDLEVLYGLAPAARGQGLALEAVTVLVAWAERREGVRRLVARVRPANEPSTRLLLRAGFAAQGGQGADGHVLWVRGRAGRPAVRVTGKHVC